MTSNALNFLSRNGQYEIGRLLALLKIFSAEERLPTASAPSNALVEMPAIKECAQQISSLSEHTVRPYALQNKLSHIRTKRGKRGINLGVEVDTIGLFENSSVILNSMGYQLFVEQAKAKPVDGQLQ